MASRCLIITSVLVIVLAYTLYTPLPEGIDEPWKLRLVLANLKIVHAFTFVGEKLGVDSRVNLTRKAFEVLFSFSSRDNRVQATDHSFDGVKVRIYRPKTEVNTVLPGLMYYHGGGWVYFSVDSYDALTSYIAAEANVAVISVEYRLAPEHPFPVPFDDCVTATVHLLRNARNYKIDAHRVGIAGDSAGGQLTAAVANRLSVEVRLPPIRLQALIYPVLQSFNFETSSYIMYADTTADLVDRTRAVGLWLYYYQGNMTGLEDFLTNKHTSAVMKVSEYAGYVKTEKLSERYNTIDVKKPIETNMADSPLTKKFEDFLLNPYANPLMVVEMTSLPPTFLLTAEYDVYRDDGLFYGQRLKEAGVYLSHTHYPGSFHGFVSYINWLFEFTNTRLAIAEMVTFVRKNL